MQKRIAIAISFSEVFDQQFKPEDINCDGCSVRGGRLYKFAEKCSVRNRGYNLEGICHNLFQVRSDSAGADYG